MLMDPNNLDSEGKPTGTIAAHLDEMYPERKVIPEGTTALHDVWTQFIGQNMLMPIFPILAPLCTVVLSERSKEYFIQTREEWFGPLNQMCPDIEEGWVQVRAGLDKVAAALDANGDGEGRNLRVIPDREPYADFVIVGSLLCVYPWEGGYGSVEELE
ncbi:hypothetical protein BD779DRAFT_606021 [Infundibulicybe gibba]|nr:hypothetical protein BD779DRAFT_606021 [Infundibulicybe gibba]